MSLSKNNLILIAFALLFGFFILSGSVRGQECGSKEDCQKKIAEYEQKLAATRQQKNTLAAEIQYADTQIYLTTLKIQSTEVNIKKTESEILSLTDKIENLNESLDHLSKILLIKIVEGYKKRESENLNLYLNVFLNSKNATEVAKNLKYIKTAEENNRILAFKMQQTKLNFEEQKTLREEKKKQLDELKLFLDNQRIALDTQKLAKKKLLTVTNNDERTYQSLLEKARAEYGAIAAIVSGGGNETKSGSVNVGDRIASIIQGSSACSSGGHLHFETVVGGSHQNPANYLSGKGVGWDLCGWWPNCDSSFSFNGSLPWPINDPVTITQGFGVTGWARASGSYPAHTGIDMTTPDSTVKSVQKGTLYQGSYACGGGSLRYVKVVPDEGDVTTYYLHVNY